MSSAQSSYLVQKIGQIDNFNGLIIASNSQTAIFGAHFLLPSEANQSLNITLSGAQKS